MKKTVLITGASSGIGKSAALRFLKKGYSVIGTARSLSRLTALKEQGVETIALDVTKEESIQDAFKKIYDKYDKIDILINNAGFTQNGFLEELSPESIRYQFEVNVFGLVRVTQMVIPKMRKFKQGKIINIGTVGGDYTGAGVSAYHASKYALESFTDAMRQELKRFGISVSIIKPGGVATDFIQNAEKFYPEPIEGNPYQKQRTQFHELMNSMKDPQNASFPLSPVAAVVDAIVKAVEAKNPKTRYKVGLTAKMIPILKTLMSDKAFDNMILKQMKLN